ncbi:ATP-binding cassette subfamily B protein/subfamily B ATP-binding cassette protein MsbA [Paenibacillus eucommiae]|uniref:ATP-binding cassette subfamily B protein/subfamily B ATP-binding cassette protein MsbA n=2 Tax=Paenibacillus eucommiae TaxID=1355755 RepID=A0ABS4J8E5_9BACL|nr:ATP-binding cassette subfamily B protein/subfamily B ATP-binding cassette protein MsbA [Paenibacillus eucommiae]
MYLISYFSNAKKNIVAQVFQQKAARDIQLAAFRKMRELGFPYFEKHAVGETMSYFQTDIPAVQEVYQHLLPRIVESLFMLLLSLLFLTSINYQLALIFIPCTIFYLVSGPYFEKKGIQYIQAYNQLIKEVDRKQHTSLSAMLELRVFHAEKWDLKKLTHVAEKAGQAMFMHFIYINLYAIMRRIAVYSGAVLLFYYAYHLIQIKALTVGEFIAFVMMYFQLMFGITHLVTTLSNQNMKLRQAEKLYAFMQIHPDVYESLHPKRLNEVVGDVHFKHVSFSYGNKGVLQDITLHIKRGERICLVGASGSGKSTITKLLGRFYDPDQGHIELDGIPIQDLSFEQLRTSVGYVFQETYLFGATVMDNIRFGNPDATDDMIVEAAKAAYAHEFIMELPEGYDSLLGERGNKLSGGQKQRVAIARMFLKNPQIVVLDEATSALDNVSEREVNDAIHRLLEGRTTLCVAHRQSTIEQYNQIVVLDQGRIVEIGTFDTLMNRKGKLSDLMQGREVSSLYA